MQNLGLNELREKYLSFFESKEHLRMQSFSLVPENDPSLLLINAGMAPLKPYFTGEKTPPKKRVTTCQKCIRTLDIENVGKTSRHGTFFEMLGNFSFGDYFKKEAITWAWEFCIDVLDLPIDRLYVTVYEEDDEAYEIWNRVVGVPAEKIVKLGKADNFWEHGTGPCGPCSEIYYDRGEENGCGKPDCAPGCDCDRFVEFWNNVFTQFDRQEDGSYEKLPNPNIDTGMGLERLACVCQGVNSIFEVDTVRKVLDKVCEVAGVEYEKEYKNDVSIRVITDHIRSTVMLVSDGVFPSNEGRGYILRRLLRRAARHGRMLGIKGLFLKEIAEVAIAESKQAYPVLEEKHDYIINVITNEEKAFNSTIDKGLKILSEIIEKTKGESKKVIEGADVFRLHDTYGFPFDLTMEIAEENGLCVDEDGFKTEMKKQQEKGRQATNEKVSSAWETSIYASFDEKDTEFVGYESYETNAKVLYLVKDNQTVDCAYQNDAIEIVLDKTSFYAESGGQKGDFGIIKTRGGVIKVKDTTKTANGLFVHDCEVAQGEIKVGDEVVTSIDANSRKFTARNHTATHLVQMALKTVLGDHIAQAGSSVDNERLRFDFSHFAALTKDEISKVESIVNEAIFAAIPVDTKVMTIEEAKKTGATALFDSKYGDSVRVVSIGDVSKEFCGGTHVANTCEIGLIKILGESGVAAGTRRIEAVTSKAAFEMLNSYYNDVYEIADILKSNVNNLKSKVENVVKSNREMAKNIDTLNQKMARANIDKILDSKQIVKGITVITAILDKIDADTLKVMADDIKARFDNCLVVLASKDDEKVTFVGMATKAAVSGGVHCGNIIKMVASACGGGGGGRPDMAQAGGKKPECTETAMAKIIDSL